jgi:tetratricopeptide (TPR) repeat protein
MRIKILSSICSVILLLLAVYKVLAVSVSEPSSTPVTPSAITRNYPKAGYVSLEYIVWFENVKRLSPEMKRATALLRTGRYQEAQTAFQNIQRASPKEALAYRGENEASRFLNTLDSTILRDQQRLSVAEAHTGPNAIAYLSALHYGLGDAMSMKNYPTPLGERPRNLGAEPKQHFLEAIRLKPNLLEAHLALAAYYEHRLQMHGTAARHEYDVAYWLRPDLYQIRYLHAASWDRPGFLGNEAQLRAHGFRISDDEKSFPERAVAECLALIHDHPNYPPPYYTLGSDYALPMYALHNDVKAKQYLSIYAKIGDPTSPWWRYAVAEVQTIER